MQFSKWDTSFTTSYVLSWTYFFALSFTNTKFYLFFGVKTWEKHGTMEMVHVVQQRWWLNWDCLDLWTEVIWVLICWENKEDKSVQSIKFLHLCFGAIYVVGCVDQMSWYYLCKYFTLELLTKWRYIFFTISLTPDPFRISLDNERL